MTDLQVRDLTVTFGRRQTLAVDRVSFDLPTGVRLGLIGASGSGKSVIAAAIVGLLPDNAHVQGSLRFGEMELTALNDRDWSRLRGRDLAMVFQEPMTALDPTMKVGRQAAEVIRLHDADRQRSARQLVEAAFDRIGLGPGGLIAEAYPHELSGGQRQRVLIAMALLNHPDLLICDEATTALDTTVQAAVLAQLDQTLTSQGSSCLFITHNLALVPGLCDHLLILRHGRIVEQGPIDQIINAPAHPYTQGLLATAQIDSIAPGGRLPVLDDYIDNRGPQAVGSHHRWRR
ncbi:MAG: ABC transporter ATP-binding protein [Propionibacteriaceae bacterium]|jgi:peptide/nickel transport system ATP-binding protein|nr:ABC transporter ATP-binding protein [Propionibacteriaceae bacterium]